MASLASHPIGAITLFDEGYDVGFTCAAVNACYCKQHGYGFHAAVLTRKEMEVVCKGRHFAWAKVALLRWLFADDADATTSIGSEIAEILLARIGTKARSELATSQWIVWLDADLMVTNHTKPLTAFLGSGAKDLVLGEDMADLDWLNTGLVACRTSSSWCRSLWSRVWDEGSPDFHQGEFWDQSGLCGCLYHWGEFQPTVVGGKRTDAPSPETPWFSWQGGPQIKETHHLRVLSSGHLQNNNPRFAQFAFHAAGMKDKSRCCRFVISSGALQGLHVFNDSAYNCPSLRTQVFREALDRVRSSAQIPYLWGWPRARRYVWSREVAIPCLGARGSATEQDRCAPLICSAVVPEHLSFQNLSEGRYGELLVDVHDRAPVYVDDAPPACRPFGFGSRVRLWEMIDYAMGHPPSQHAVLREMDSERLWRTRWNPWQDNSFGASPSKDMPFPKWVGFDIGNLPVPSSSILEIAPPGAVTRMHQPLRGDAGWLIWQLEGVQQIALVSTVPRHIQAAACEEFTLLGSHQSRYDPWDDPNAEVYTAVLCKGEALLVPAGWFFTARTLQPSMCLAGAVNERMSTPAPAKTPVGSSRQAAVRLLQDLDSQGFKKNVLGIGRQGSPPRVQRFNAVCHVEIYRGLKGDMVRSTRADDAPQVLHLGADSSLGKIDQLVRSMSLGERALAAFNEPQSGGPIAVDVELLAVRLPAERAGRPSSFELYTKAWWTWFEDPASWQPLPGNSGLEKGVGQRCKRCMSFAASLRCSRCSSTFYCCKACQREDWPVHRVSCRQPASA